MALPDNLFGKDGFYWFTGVVEDRKEDPDKLGRVRVRIYGYHSGDKEVLPTEDLPWAIIMQPTTSAAVSGKGYSPTFLLEGTWVIGFFLDGKEKQQPIIIGTVGGFTQKVPFCGETSTFEEILAEGLAEVGEGEVGNELVTGADGEPVFENIGGSGGLTIEETEMWDFDLWEEVNEMEMVETEAFQDPNGEFPLCTYIEKPDTNKLAIPDLEDDDTPVFKKLENRTEGIATALDGEEWDEPEPAFCPEYPFNKVFETEKGHVVEYDDTPGKERIHIFHTVGTYIEIDVNGTFVRKVMGDDFELVEGNGHTYIKGSHTLTVEKVMKMYVKGDLDLQVDGDVNALVEGDVNAKIEGDTSIDADGDLAIKAGGDIGITAGGDFAVQASSVGITSGDFAVQAGTTTFEVADFGVNAAAIALIAATFGVEAATAGITAPLASIGGAQLHLVGQVLGSIPTGTGIPIPAIPITGTAVTPAEPTAPEGNELEPDLIRPDCELEEPEYLEIEEEDYFIDEGPEGILPMEFQEVGRDFEYVPEALPPVLDNDVDLGENL